jgi:hypothetical protein
MKRIALLFLILSVIGCTKNKESNSIVGTWALTQINSAYNSSVLLLGTEVSVEFKSDGSFDILGPKSNYTYLQDFNRYEMMNDNKIRFFSTNSNDELLAFFEVNKTLSLFYQVRCPYEEKFIRR